MKTVTITKIPNGIEDQWHVTYLIGNIPRGSDTFTSWSELVDEIKDWL